MTYMTMRKLCDYSGWDFKKSSDDRANGADFILTGNNGRFICDLDDCAAAFAYVHLREAGQTVRVAGASAKRLREAMAKYPQADQLTAVTTLNGLNSIHPTADLDLSTGYLSGGYVQTATMFDVRNLRDRVRQAVEADQEVIGADHGE
ncbi:hypothetical protein [Alteriqipengyuania lutimaris]|uniref:hypothetical protein n=1 Tax=Alteriqipengyuania lutimaris TaxID=1538146 RepID=UPI001CFE804B|nr:hypothetical protein [Alteriqipengyuania lutimaris]